MTTKYKFATNKSERQILVELLKTYIDNETKMLIDGPTIDESHTPVDIIIDTIGEHTKLMLRIKLEIFKADVTLHVPGILVASIRSLLLNESDKLRKQLIDCSVGADDMERLVYRLSYCERMFERMNHSRPVD